MRKFENRPNPTTTFCQIPGDWKFFRSSPTWNMVEGPSAYMSQSRHRPNSSRPGGVGYNLRHVPEPPGAQHSRKFYSGFQYKFSVCEAKIPLFFPFPAFSTKKSNKRCSQVQIQNPIFGYFGWYRRVQFFR